MKIFRVSIDNNPGGWKSGLDNYVLIPAKNKEDAIKKLKNGYGENFKSLDDGYCYEYAPNGDQPYISYDAVISAIEIKFEGYELVETRILKIKNILEDE